jgi:hypothetical protein
MVRDRRVSVVRKTGKRQSSGFLVLTVADLLQVTNFLDAMAKEIDLTVPPVPQNKGSVHNRPIANGSADSNQGTTSNPTFDPMHRKLQVQLD